MALKGKDQSWRRRAERLRRRRRALDLTLEVIAARLGVGIPTVHRWERGASRPNERLANEWESALFVEAK